MCAAVDRIRMAVCFVNLIYCLVPTVAMRYSRSPGASINMLPPPPFPATRKSSDVHVAAMQSRFQGLSSGADPTTTAQIGSREALHDGEVVSWQAPRRPSH
ncbi:hypothetical protein Micbo1qcDRAFT_24860 [Microdochium bolleyi]|uniref:Uncharacterized protein n=1 Tax=Microdochium bolleyi TaxID=196109 RepID=A0A136JDI2_9PEZI|nr:hypothetical protein Micbo1qcDRAFT_24860 [Microdochium bolleyi]